MIRCPRLQNGPCVAYTSKLPVGSANSVLPLGPTRARLQAGDGPCGGPRYGLQTASSNTPNTDPWLLLRSASEAGTSTISATSGAPAASWTLTLSDGGSSSTIGSRSMLVRSTTTSV